MASKKVGMCPTKCKSCVYSIKMGQETTCNYILVKGRMRGCEVTVCDKYERKKRGRKKKVA